MSRSLSLTTSPSGVSPSLVSAPIDNIIMVSHAESIDTYSLLSIVSRSVSYIQ